MKDKGKLLQEAIVGIVKQESMTDECWMVQLFGLGTCDSCAYKGKKDCGGKKIRKSGVNSKGIKPPLISYSDGNKTKPKMGGQT